MFWRDIGGTVVGWGFGVLVAVAIAVPLGLAIGSSKIVWRATRVVVEVLRPLPAIAILPLLLLQMGLGLQLKIVVVAIGAFWPLLIQTIYGVHDVEPIAWDMARAYRLGYLERFRSIVLPTALPYIGTGLRISAVIGLNICIAEELLVGGSSRGLGTAIAFMENAARFDQMYVFVVASGLIGVLINIGFRRLERRLLFWHPSERFEART